MAGNLPRLLLFIVFCQLPYYGHSSIWPHLDERLVGKLAKLTDDHQYVVPSQQIEDEVRRQRALRNAVAAEMYKHSHTWEEDEDVVARANSFAQIVHSSEQMDDRQLLNSSSATKQNSSWGCLDIPVSGCGDDEKGMCIKRIRTNWEAAKVFFGKLEVTMMMSLGAVLSVFIFGMFTAFFAANAAAVSSGLIASCQTVMNTAVYQSWLSATLALTVGLGVTGGLLSQTVTSQTGLSWKSIQRQQEMAEDFKFAHTLQDHCPTIIFQSDQVLNLDTLERTSHRMASSSMWEWCTLMNREDMKGRSLWDQEGVMPVPSACKTVKRPDSKRAKKEPVEWFNCYDLLLMQDEEITYQAGVSYFNLSRSDNRLDEFNGQDCSEMVFTSTPVSTGLGALCREIDRMRKENMLTLEQHAKQRQRIEGIHNEMQEDHKVASSLVQEESNSTKANLAVSREWARVIAMTKRRLTALEKENSQLSSPNGQHDLMDHAQNGGTKPKTHDDRLTDTIGQMASMEGQRAGKDITGTFEAEALGISANWKTGKIHDVKAGGQGEKNGAAPGMYFKTVDGKPYSEALLDEKLKGGKSFSIIFSTAAMGDDAKGQAELRDDKGKYRYLFTKEGATHFGPSSTTLRLDPEPKEGGEILDGYLPTIERAEGLHLKELVAEGYALKQEVPWEEREENKKPPEVTVKPATFHVVPPVASKEAREKQQKLADKIAKTKKTLEDLETERDKHMNENPGLSKPPQDFQVDDMPDNEDVVTGPTTLDVEQGGSGIVYTPQPPLPDEQSEAHTEEEADDYEKMLHMKAAEASKAQAIHNCLAAASCQLLRKNVAVLQEQEITKGMFYNNRKVNILQDITQRCLSHTMLYGAANGGRCKPGVPGSRKDC